MKSHTSIIHLFNYLSLQLTISNHLVYIYLYLSFYPSNYLPINLVPIIPGFLYEIRHRHELEHQTTIRQTTTR